MRIQHSLSRRSWGTPPVWFHSHYRDDDDYGEEEDDDDGDGEEEEADDDGYDIDDKIDC